jgi:hypothetical protein
MRKMIIAAIMCAAITSACGEVPQENITINNGEIVQIVKHDDVKKKVCASYRYTYKKVRNKKVPTKVCAAYKTVEVSSEWYEFKLLHRGKTGWVRVDEATGESYRVGDQYP